MYMFFWFFKQFYYILRRIFKKSLLLLFIFFIIFLLFFVKKTFAMEFQFNNNSYDLPDFTDYKYFFIGYDSSPSFPNHYYLWASTVEDYDCFFKYNTFIQNGRGTSYCYYLSLDGTTWQYQTSVNKNTSLAQYSQYIGSTAPIHRLGSNDNPYYEPNISLFINPSITTPSSSIINWSFDDLTINCGSVPRNAVIELDFTYNNNDYSLNINNYYTITDNTIIITVPRNILSKYFVVRSGNPITFNLYVRDSSTIPSTIQYYDLGTYTLNLTSQEEQQINENSDKELLNDISNNQKETTDAVENLESTITDTNIDDNSITFPTLDVPDLARDGLTHIFDAFVLAFCSTTPEDIILPIPNTNKTITIPYNYTYNMLSNYSPTLLNLVSLFWWYWIARIIVYDIYDKMDKIQSGDVENLQKENVTTNML